MEQILLKSLKREKLAFMLRRWGNIVFWVSIAIGFLNVFYVIQSTISIVSAVGYMRSMTNDIVSWSSNMISLRQIIDIAVNSLVGLIMWLIIGVTVKLFLFR